MIIILFLTVIVSHSTAFDLQNEFLVSCGERSEESVLKVIDLIDKGANVFVKTSGGESALHLSCIWDHPAKVSTLLRAGADPNVRASSTPASLDMTPLTWCVYGNREESVKILLNDARTNVNLIVKQEDGSYITALDIAKKIGNSDIFNILAASGAHSFSSLQIAYERDEEGLKELMPPDDVSSSIKAMEL